MTTTNNPATKQRRRPGPDLGSTEAGARLRALTWPTHDDLVIWLHERAARVSQGRHLCRNDWLCFNVMDLDAYGERVARDLEDAGRILQQDTECQLLSAVERMRLLRFEAMRSGSSAWEPGRVRCRTTRKGPSVACEASRQRTGTTSCFSHCTCACRQRLSVFCGPIR